jgi:class 3 adenylate cyclase/tetratricopeptide (TPR) repeat protein
MLTEIHGTQMLLCDRCHHPAPPKARFCPSCGFRLPSEREAKYVSVPDHLTPTHLGERILIAREALGGERKQVTALFADVFASMTILEEQGAEEGSAILDEILERMVEAVHHYEGTVHKTMGDGIMALFGAPLAYEDHALRACYAALRMQARLGAYSDELQRSGGIPVQIRVGLNSGEVVMRTIGSDLQMAFSAVGQTVHLSSRMEQLAKPGTILTTRETVNLVEPRVRVRPLGPVRVKGLPEAVEAYEVIGAAAVASTVRIRSAFFGREDDMARLTNTLQVAQKNTGQLVVIRGEPGIGKTRLLHEFLQICRAQGCLVLDAAAAPYGRATGHRVGLDILRQYFGVETREDPQRVREKVSTKTLALDPGLGAAVPALLWQLGALEDGSFHSLDLQTRCQQALEANLRLIRREALRQPLVLALDNLQWVDSEAEQALEFLARDVPRSTLLVVTHRPEYHSTWMDRPDVVNIRLEALPVLSSAALLDDLLGNDPSVAALKELLVERAGGNPLFLEECVHNLIQRGLLAAGRGAHRLAGSVTELDVPPSIRSLLEGRLDQLSPQSKHVLQCAAVIGPQVPVWLLQEIVDLPEEEVLAVLAQLRDLGLIDQIMGFPEPSYAFHHSLTHDVAYGSLLHDRRRALHGRVVEAMERESPEDRSVTVEQLAQHSMHGGLWAKAVEYLRESGNQALSTGGSREAVEFLNQALRTASHLPSAPETRRLAINLREDLSRALTVAGQSLPVVALLREAAELAEDLMDERRLARVLSFLSNSLWNVGDLPAAIETSERAAAIAKRLGRPELEAVANFCRGGGLRALGDYRAAVDYLRRNLPLLTGELSYETLGLAGLASVLTRGHLAWSLAELGEFVEARQHGEEALRLAQVANHPYSLAHAHLAMGGTLLRQGWIAEAMGMLEQGLELCRDAPFLYPPLAADLAVVYGLSGRTSAAVELARQAVTRAEEGGRLGRLSLIVTHLGEVYHLAGQADEAAARARWALELACERGELGNQVYALRLSGLVAAEWQPPDVENAKRHFGEALKLAERLGMRPLLARCHLGIGRLSRRLGEADAAKHHLTAATQLFEVMDMNFWLGRLVLDRIAPHSMLCRVRRAYRPKGDAPRHT